MSLKIYNYFFNYFERLIFDLYLFLEYLFINWFPFKGNLWTSVWETSCFRLEIQLFFLFLQASSLHCMNAGTLSKVKPMSMIRKDQTTPVTILKYVKLHIIMIIISSHNFYNNFLSFTYGVLGTM